MTQNKLFCWLENLAWHWHDWRYGNADRVEFAELANLFILQLVSVQGMFRKAFEIMELCEHQSKFDRYNHLSWHTYYIWEESWIVCFSPRRKMN